MIQDEGATRSRLLSVIEHYYDAAPRTAARVETIGPFTLFVNEGAGWPYYARPSLGATLFNSEDVARVRDRQRPLGVPEAFEWVAETSPGVRAAAVAAGLVVVDHPLMNLPSAAARRVPPPAGFELRLVTPDDDLARCNAVARIAFGEPGTAVGTAGEAELSRAASGEQTDLSITRERLGSGRTVTAVVLHKGTPVAVGSHQPVGAVSEVVGVGTLPAFRRRGLAAALTSLLVEDAHRRGATTVFLSAGDALVARIYEQVGFQLLGTACIAEPASH